MLAILRHANLLLGLHHAFLSSYTCSNTSLVVLLFLFGNQLFLGINHFWKSTMNIQNSPHQELATSLQISRVAIDRSFSMWVLVQHMGYLSVQDKKRLLVELCAQSDIYFSITDQEWAKILEKSANNFGEISLESSVLHNIIRGLANENIPEWLPSILAKITGENPAEADPVEVAKMQADMDAETIDTIDTTEDDGWDNWYTKSEEIENIEEADFLEDDIEKDTDEYSEELSIDEMEDSWDIIFKKYSVEDNSYTYSMLFSNDGDSIPTPQPQEEHTEFTKKEKQLLQDLQRRNHTCRNIALLTINIDIPTHNTKENISSSDMQVEKTEQIDNIGFDVFQHQKIQMFWGGGCEIPLQLPKIDPTKRRSKLAKQTFSHWQISWKTVKGTFPAFRWKINNTIEQHIHATGGLSGIIHSRNHIFYQIVDENGQWLMGTSPEKTAINGLPNHSFVASDSHHMSILQDNSPIDLLHHSQTLIANTEPILRQTPPLDQHQSNQQRAKGKSSTLRFQYCLEESIQVEQQDTKLRTDIHCHQWVGIRSHIELEMGNKQQGWKFTISPKTPMAIVHNTGHPKHPQSEMHRDVGTLLCYRNGDTYMWELQHNTQVVYTEKTDTQTYPVHRETGWLTHLHTEQIDSNVLSHTTQQKNTTYGWSLHNKELDE